jgi:hypothetical protein
VLHARILPPEALVVDQPAQDNTRNCLTRALKLLGRAIVAGIPSWSLSVMEAHVPVAHYLRVSIGRWNIDTPSPKAERMVRQV